MENSGTSTPPSNSFMVEDYLVEPAASVISKGGQSLHLEPKTMDLLVYMAQQPGRVFSREELLGNVWSGVIVSDEALTNAIIKLRKAFNDKAKNSRVIETLPKRGYRLIAQVIQIDHPEDKPSQSMSHMINGNIQIVKFQPGYFVWIIIALATIAAFFWFGKNETTYKPPASEVDGLSLPDKPSIAVLPFVNTSNEIEHSYFSDGITDDLITDLSKLSGLFVISRNSTFQYKGQAVDVKQIAHKLGVQFILEGSVRRIGDQVRINTQLIDGISGGQLWAERYDGNLDDVFKLQDRVTEKIINALALHLSEQDQAQLVEFESTSADAYDEYLKGWEHHWRVNRDDFARAQTHFKKALELDPDFERAHVALAHIYWQSWQQKWHLNSGSRGPGWARARRELDAITQPLPLAHSLRSSMHLYNRRYDEAISEAKRAVDLNPGSATGYLALSEALGFAGHPEEAIIEAKKAFRLDPNFPAPYLFVEALALFDLKQYEESIKLLNRIISARPDHTESSILLIASYGHMGRKNDAQQVLEKLNHHLRKGQLPDLTIDWQKNRWPYRNLDDRDRLFEGLKKAGVPEW